MNKEKLKSDFKSVARIFVIFLIVYGSFRLLVWLFHHLTN